jgi:glyoxylase-like metal-dependent hydrolase (beta-lactamase superfamily II)
MVKLDLLRSGITNTYLLRDQGAILVDPGMAGNAPVILKWLDRLSIAPEAIRLIVLTHGHFDHAGCAAELRAALGAKIALGRADAERLERGALPLPSGNSPWGGFMAGSLKLVARAMPSMERFQLRADLIMGEEGLGLAEYGVAGRILPTPGHSAGSLSILLDDGAALVGDLAMNGAPFCLRPSLGILGEDLAQMRQSAQRLLDLGAQAIYPAHGKPFPAAAWRVAL